ncbi:MAG: Hsp20/alpha crystallin family protein [Bdellovibrionota bacterium]
MADKHIPITRNSDDRREANPLQDMERMLETYFTDPFAALYDFPVVNRRTFGEIKETDEAYILCADVPGVPTEDVQIDVHGNMLSIKAEYKQEDIGKGGYRRHYRNFQQSFALPSTVDADRIEAHCEHGVLEVLLPKTAASQPKRVEVQTGKGGFWNRLVKKVAPASADAKAEPKKH